MISRSQTSSAVGCSTQRALTALVLLLALQTVQGTIEFGLKFTGDATYYGFRTRGFGHCSFHFHGFGTSKGYAGTPLAINAAQYTGTSVCGLCVKYKGSGQGLGGTPVSTDWQPGFICDECPECKFGDLDQQEGGDGRWKVEWYPVQCPVGESTFRFGYQGGNPWYRKIMIANARVPLKAVKIQQDGSWTELTKTIDNYWEFHGSVDKVWSPCAKVQITSILGNTVEDSICCTSGTCQGQAQFPCNPSLPGDDCKGSKQEPEKVNSGGIGLAGPQNNPVQAVANTVQAVKDAGQQAVQGVKDAGQQAAEGVKSKLDRFGRAADIAVARVATSPRVLSVGAQCGGSAYDCARFGKDQCRDQQFDNTKCEQGSCVRNDDKWWGCK